MSSGKGAATPRLRVVRVVPELDYGGVETRVLTQASLMHAHGADIHVVTLHRPGATAGALRRDGVPVHVLGMTPSIRSWRTTIALTRLLRSLRPDIVHASIAEANVHAVCAARLAGVSVVFTEEVGVPARSPRARALMGAMHRLATRVIAVSDATREYLVSREGVPRGRIERVYNCYRTGLVCRSTPPPAGSPRLLMVGRLVAEKDHATALLAFAALVRAGRDRGASLDIAGAGPLEGALRALAARLGIGERVNLLGYRSDVPELLASATGLLMPSTHEGYGIALVEAMASGVPIISSTAGGLVEVTQGYPAEWLCLPGDVAAWSDAIGRLLELSIAEQEQLGRTAADLAASRFGPEAYVARLEEVYRSASRRRDMPATASNNAR